MIALIRERACPQSCRQVVRRPGRARRHPGPRRPGAQSRAALTPVGRSP